MAVDQGRKSTPGMSHFFDKYGFAFGKGANVVKTVFGFGGGDLHGGLLMDGYFS
jgi:hypothetical protein